MYYLNYIALGLYKALEEIEPGHSALNKINLNAFSLGEPCFIGEKSLLPIINALNDVGFHHHYELKWLAEQVRSFVGEQRSLSYLARDSLALAFRSYIFNAPTLGDFIVRLIEYATFTNRTMFFDINSKKDYVEIKCCFNNKEQDFNSGYGPLFFISYCTQMLFGTDVKIDLFIYDGNEFDNETYQSYVSGSIISAKDSYLRFKKGDFNTINKHYNCYIDNSLKSHLENLKPREPDFNHISDDVLSKIKMFFMENNNYISADEMACQLNMSKSTLYRKLEAENTSYRELVEVTRKDIALKLIQESNISFGQISDALGYSNLTAFNRAFRRWLNVSPSEYKNSLGI